MNITIYEPTSDKELKSEQCVNSSKYSKKYAMPTSSITMFYGEYNMTKNITKQLPWGSVTNIIWDKEWTK